jgi:hypothetical protein
VAVLATCLGVRAAAPEKPHPPPPTDALGILETHCVKCHGGEKTKSGLDLTTREALLRGGESGAAFAPGEPAESSLLYRMIAHLEEPGMPHKEDPMPTAAIEQIAGWLRAGAPYSRELNTNAGGAKSKTDFTITAVDRAHWSFQPVRRPPVVLALLYIHVLAERRRIATIVALGFSRREIFVMHLFEALIVGGSPVRSSVTRRISVSLLAGGEGRSAFASCPARMK